MERRERERGCWVFCYYFLGKKGYLKMTEEQCIGRIYMQERGNSSRRLTGKDSE